MLHTVGEKKRHTSYAARLKHSSVIRSQNFDMTPMSSVNSLRTTAYNPSHDQKASGVPLSWRYMQDQSSPKMA